MIWFVLLFLMVGVLRQGLLSLIRLWARCAWAMHLAVHGSRCVSLNRADRRRLGLRRSVPYRRVSALVRALRGHVDRWQRRRRWERSLRVATFVVADYRHRFPLAYGMTTKMHTDITPGASGNVATINSPLGQLDNALADLEAQFSDFVVVGGLAATSASLVITVPATRAFVLNTYVSIGATNLTMPASTDNYVDIDSAGALHVTSVAHNAAAPAVFASSLRLFMAVSTGTAVTPITDLRVTGLNGAWGGSLRIKGGDPWIDVTHPSFGAKAGGFGTGPDCLAAIQAADAYAVTLGGGILFYPAAPGLFYNTSTMYAQSAHVHQRGAGRDLSIIYCTATTIAGASNGAIKSVGNASIRDLTIQTTITGANVGRVLSLTGPNFSLERCQLDALGNSATNNDCFNVSLSVAGSVLRVNDLIMTSAGGNCFRHSGTAPFHDVKLRGVRASITGTNANAACVALAGSGTGTSSMTWVLDDCDFGPSPGQGMAGAQGLYDGLQLANTSIHDTQDTCLTIQGPDNVQLINVFCDRRLVVSPLSMTVSLATNNSAGFGNLARFTVNNLQIFETSGSGLALELAQIKVTATGVRIFGSDGVGPGNGVTIHQCPGFEFSNYDIDTVGICGINVTTSAIGGEIATETYGVIGIGRIANWGLTPAVLGGSADCAGVLLQSTATNKTHNVQTRGVTFVNEPVRADGRHLGAIVTDNTVGGVLGCQIGPNDYINVTHRRVFAAGSSPVILDVDPIFALTDAATIATDRANSQLFGVTLGGNRTLGAPTNAFPGAIATWLISEDGTGGRTLAFDAVFLIRDFKLNTQAGALSVLVCEYDGTNWQQTSSSYAGSKALRVFALTDAATVAIDALKGEYFTLAATAGRTIGAPSNAFSGARFVVDLLNSSGGAITTTWNAAFVFTATGHPDPANGKRRKFQFTYDGTSWIEDWHSGADI